MVQILSPFPKLRFCDDNGNALVGGKLFTYIAGTIATKTPTWTDSGGGTPNTNPIILDSRGEANVWLDPAVNYKFALAPSTDTDPPTNAFWVVDHIVPPNSATITLGSIADSLAGTSSAVAATPVGTAKAIQQGFSFGTTTGTANAIAVSPAITPAALADGMLAEWIATLTNTGATTLNFGGLGTVDLKKWGGSTGAQALGGGEVSALAFHSARYSSALSAWILQEPNGVSVWPPGSLSGLTLSRAGATTFGIALGTASSENAGTRQDMTLVSAFTKTLSAFATGTGNGALDTGAIGANSTYHVHLIRRDSDGLSDVLLSLSVAAPTMPAGYTARRRIGSILTNGASQIIAFSQDGDEFLLDVAVVDVNALNPGTAAVLRTLSIPTGVKMTAIINGGLFSNTTNAPGLNLSSPDASDQVSQDGNATSLTGIASISGMLNGANTVWVLAEFRIRTNTSGQIRSRLFASGANDRVGIITRGWLDRRGRG